MKRGSSKNEPKSAAAAPPRGISTGVPGRAEELLRAIIQVTAATTGTQFFRSLVRHLAEGLHVRFAFVAECLPNLRARSLAFFQDNNLGADFEYALPGTPCMEVAKGRVCHVPDRLPGGISGDEGVTKRGTGR